MRVLIFEPDSGGHRLQYVAAILDALAPLPVSTVVVCERGIRDGEEYATHLAGIRGAFELHDAVPSMRGKPAYAVGVLRFLALRKAIERHRPDHVYIPYADGVIQVAGVARNFGFSLSRPDMEIEALMMRGQFAYHSRAVSMRTRMVVKALERAPFDIVHHLDPIVYDHLRQHFRELAARVRLVPEAVEGIARLDSHTARLKLGICPDGKYVGCLGALSAGKGVAQLLKAFADAPLAADTRLLLIGKPDPELRRLLDGEYRPQCTDGRIIHIDRYVSQDEFHLGLSASDVVCAVYLRQIGSSGIVVRAAAAGRVLVGSDFGWVGRVIRDFGLGVVCNVTDVPRLSAAIMGALALSETYSPGPYAQLFSNFHSMDNFGRHWTRRLRERLRMASAVDLRAWKWPDRALPL